MHEVHPVGRESELATIREFLSRPDGPPALVVSGDPGIGKTTLWEAGLAVARELGFRVLMARPSEPEVQLSYVGLADLLEGVELATLRDVPSPQRRALEVALLRTDPDATPPEPFAVSAGFTAALRGLARESPLLVAVDDVPWIDRSSADALAFAARRLEPPDVRFLFARRPGDPSVPERALGVARLERLALGPLSLGATRSLLAARLGLSLPRRVLRRVFELSGGNPLFALELGRVLAERGVPEDGLDLQLPEVVDDLFGARVKALPAPLRRLLLAVALTTDPRAGPLATIASEATIEDAIDAGLLDLDGDRLRPSHPLLSVAARGVSNARERRELHVLLARAASDDELRARHLALAAIGPDAKLAEAVDRAAAAAAARGARDDAVDLGEQALRLTPQDGTRRVERLLAFARYLHAADETERLATVLNAALHSLPRGAARAQAFLLLSESDATDSIDALDRFFDLALAECPDDVSIRARVLAKRSAYTVASKLERLDEAASWAAEALALATTAELGPDVERLALEASGWVRAFTGRPLDDIRQRFHALSEPAPLLADTPERAAILRQVWRGELAAARVDLDRARTTAEEHGEPLSLALLSFDLTDLELRVGNLDAAAALLDELADPDILATPAYEFSRALLAAGRGDPAEAERWASEAIARAQAFGIRYDELEALRARGPAALLEGDAQRAADSLHAVWEHTQREDVDEPGAFPVAPDLVEALVGLNRLDEAREVTERLERLAVEQEHPWGLASAKRCRALTGLVSAAYDGHAAALATDAAESYGALGLRFDQARTFLILGRAQRRHKRWAEARRSLEQAVAVFGELGAEGWAERTRAELERVGARRPAPQGTLTTTEERVARLAADGLSNKEIAAQLVVSVYTVEKHLSHAYHKLGVRSRGQLAARLSAAT